MPARPARVARRLLSAATLFVATVAAAQPLPTLPKTADHVPLILRSDILGLDGTVDPSLIDFFDAVVDGINANAVARLSVFVTPTSGFSCTGALVGPHTILTAAHCVTDDLTGDLVTGQDRVRARFVGPGNTPVDIWSRSVVVRDSWQGFFNPASDGGQDVALIDLDGTIPNWLTPYSIFHGDPFFQNTDFIGAGTFGNGALGDLGFDGRRRWGQNRVDLVSDPFFGPGDGILWTDFDNGLRRSDAFCWATGGGDPNPFCNRGRGPTEMGLGAGDSGGPLFIDQQLAGVASFGTVFCGDPECNTFASPPLFRTNVIDGWGSLNGFASVQYNEAWILSQIAGFNSSTVVVSTPEPTTIALTALGLLALGVHARRRTRAG